jgi:competence protein ComEA
VDTATPPVGAPRPQSGDWQRRLDAWRSRLSGRAVAVAAGVVGAVVVAVGVLLLLGEPFGPPARLTLPRADGAPEGPAAGSGPGAGAPADPGQGATGAPVPGAQAPVVTVHAAGAVARPGVYVLPSGARVADVVTAAGGALPEADLDRLNLAARVNDGDRISVARKGDPVAPAVPPGGGEPAAASSGPAGPAGSGPLDLNAATAEQLDTLPGIGPATARSIITYRTRHGRFRSVTELLEVPGIGPTKLEALRPLVRV